MIDPMRYWLVLALAACHYSPDYTGTSYLCDDGKCPSGYTCVNARCVLGPDQDAPMLDGPTIDAPQLPWWNTSFTKRAQLTIKDVAGDPLGTGFPIGLEVNLATLDSATAVWDALRVVHWDPVTTQWTELTRYPENSVNNPRTVWFDLVASLGTGSTTGEYYLYFGNASPTTAPSSGGLVFDFYDAFSGTAVDTNKWVIQGTPGEAGDNLTLHAGDSVHTKVQYSTGHAVACSLTAPQNTPRFWLGFQRLNDFSDGDPWLIWVNRGAGDSEFPAGYSATTLWPETYVTAFGMSTPDYGTAEPLDGGKHLYTVQLLADRVVYKYEEHEIYEFALPGMFTTNLQVRLANETSPAADMVFGACHVRKAVWPDPTVTVGVTEMQ
jgi:hypothetical protein